MRFRLLSVFAAIGVFRMWCAEGPTPAELAIRGAEAEIAKNADFSGGYNHLAMAYARRAREADNASYYDKGEAALNKSLELSPGNYDARKATVLILLGRHEWSAALALAQKLNREIPDDVMIYGYIADAKIALGDFEGAVESTQWMLNLRPGNAAGMIRAGRLRELYHEWNGAVEALQTAFEATPIAETEERAWIVRQMSRVYAEMGDAKNAESAANQARALFPQALNPNPTAQAR
jgi:tetratricopeptide (TPR) repeat protein